MGQTSETLLSDALNFPVRETPAGTGLALLRETIPHSWRRQPDNLQPFRLYGQLHDLAWHAPTRPAALHSYDKNAMYPASLGAVILGSGNYSIAGEFKRLPGLWQVRIDHMAAPWDERQAPAVTLPGIRWLYTDLVVTMAALDYRYEVIGGYVFHETHQMFRAFYERIRVARNRLVAMDTEIAADARALLKRTYGAALACLVHEPDQPLPYPPLMRPDWYYGLISHAASRMFADMYHIYTTTGELPVLVETDTLGYRSNVPLQIGAGIGNYREVVKKR